MKKPFRPGWLQASLGATVDARPSGEPALLVRSEAPFRQLRRSRAALSHDPRPLVPGPRHRGPRARPACPAPGARPPA
jgi:hypothetical protein